MFEFPSPRQPCWMSMTPGEMLTWRVNLILTSSGSPRPCRRAIRDSGRVHDQPRFVLTIFDRDRAARAAANSARRRDARSGGRGGVRAFGRARVGGGYLRREDEGEHADNERCRKTLGARHGGRRYQDGSRRAQAQPTGRAEPRAAPVQAKTGRLYGFPESSCATPDTRARADGARPRRPLRPRAPHAPAARTRREHRRRWAAARRGARAGAPP